MPMLDLQDSSQVKFAIEQKNKRFQLNDALQDFFAVNPKTYHRSSGEDNLGKDVFYPEESEESQSGAIDMSNSLDDTYHVSKSYVEKIHSQSPAINKSNNNSCTSLDGTFHVRKSYVQDDESSLDATLHKERQFRQPLPCTTQQQQPPTIPSASKTTTAIEKSRSGRRVTWKTDFDPSDGTIE